MPTWNEPNPKGKMYHTSIITVQLNCFKKVCSNFMLHQRCLNSKILGDWLEKDRPALCLQLKAGAWSPGCSSPGILGYDEAYKSPGSPPPPEVSGPGCAASQMTDGSDSFVLVHYGSSHQQASGCDVQLMNGQLLCGCCSCFFAPVREKQHWSCVWFCFDGCLPQQFSDWSTLYVK